MHISSIVVLADPAQAVVVREGVDALPGLQTHLATDDGRLVVTVEAASEASSIALIGAVQDLPGVLAVAMAYHQFEPDPDQEV